MADKKDQFTSQKNKGSRARVIHFEDRRKNVAISVIKPMPGFKDRRLNSHAAPVISMAERIEKESRKRQVTVHMQKIAQHHRMSIGQMAYDRYRRQQRFLYMRQMRSSSLTMILTVILLVTSGYISYKTTSAWFTNRPIKLSTYIDTNFFEKSKSSSHRGGKHKVIKQKKEINGTSINKVQVN